MFVYYQGHVYTPSWTPLPLRPWRMENEAGELLRKEPKDGMHEAYTFDTSAKAAAHLLAKGGKGYPTFDALTAAIAAGTITVDGIAATGAIGANP